VHARLFRVSGRCISLTRFKSLGDGRFVRTTGPRTRLAFVAGDAGPPLMNLALDAGMLLFERREPFAPAPAELAECAGTYRSDEIELAYRVVVQERALRLERMKAPPSPLQPIVADTVIGEPGTVSFVRDATGRVSGFVLDAGRVRHVRFRRETSPGT
jgi:hypothetical protein